MDGAGDDDHQGQVAARRERRALLICYGFSVLGLAIGIPLKLVAEHHHVPAAVGAPLAVLVGLLYLTGPAAALALYIHWHGQTMLQTGPLERLGVRERRYVARSIRRNEPVSPEYREIALSAARRLADQGHWATCWVLFPVQVAVVNLVMQAGLLRVMSVAMLCLAVGGTVYQYWLSGRARLVANTLAGN